MHAFIVRPFGFKHGIDYDLVESELIRPALDKAGFSGGTTGELVQQGNIRTDMFEQLLIADLVVVDISIHNANCFYENVERLSARPYDWRRRSMNGGFDACEHGVYRASQFNNPAIGRLFASTQSDSCAL